MSDMTERVAGAIYEATAQIAQNDEASGLLTTNAVRYKILARAAISAMHDPDHDMTASILAPGDDRTGTVKSWNKMIDAALTK